MTEDEIRQVVAAAIQKAAERNSYCSIVPGPVVAAIYADAAMHAITQLAQTVEPWHGQAQGNS